VSGLDPTDARLLAALEGGLPRVPRPFQALGAAVGLDEAEVIARLRALKEAGVVRRFGFVVRHHELGFKANAMAVFDVPDDRVADVGAQLAELPFVRLCYRRERHPPVWPYNLFAMIHGRERATVEAQADDAADRAGIAHCPRALLFSSRRFKQKGAAYGRSRTAAA